MKRNIALLITSVIAMSGIFTGCSEKEEPASPAVEVVDEVGEDNDGADDADLPQEVDDTEEPADGEDAPVSLAELDKQLAEEARNLPSSPEEYAKSIPEVPPLGAKTDADLSRIDEYVDFHLPKNATEEQCQQFSDYILWATNHYETTLGTDLGGLYDIITTFNDLCRRCIDRDIPLTKDGLIFENYDRAIKALEDSWEFYDLSKANELYGKQDVIDNFHEATGEYREWVNEQKKIIREEN